MNSPNDSNQKVKVTISTTLQVQHCLQKLADRLGITVPEMAERIVAEQLHSEAEQGHFLTLENVRGIERKKLVPNLLEHF